MEVTERYLAMARYLEWLPKEERHALLVENDASIPSVLLKLDLAKGAQHWLDAGDPPTAPALLRLLVPVVSLRKSYQIGKDFREVLWRIWNANAAKLQQADRDLPEATDPKATVQAMWLLAAAEMDVTAPQAERYTKLCRYVLRKNETYQMGGNRGY